MTAEDRLREKLMVGLNPVRLDIINESHMHAGHRSSPGSDPRADASAWAISPTLWGWPLPMLKTPGRGGPVSASTLAEATSRT